MAQLTYHFPRGFLWGTATSSHQVEGNNTNNQWWAWEQQPGRIIKGDKSGRACEWWGGRWREDFDRAAEGGQNSHRFSIEWSRVQPAPDRWDENAIDRYRDIARGAIERGLTPLVALHHFSDPLWLVERGGWENDQAALAFENFAAKVVEALKEYVSLWITVNEINLYSVEGHLTGHFPPGKRDLRAAARVGVNLLKAHGCAYRRIHTIQPQARVGLSYNYRSFHPANPSNPLDRWAASLHHKVFNEAFPKAIASGDFRFLTIRQHMPEVQGTQDFFGLNYYTREYVAFQPSNVDNFFCRRFFAPGAELSETGFIANEPHGIFEAIKWATRFKLPIIITENGVEDSADTLRPRYLIQHLHQVWRGVNFNFPVKGYFHWTLVDNFEWERGWSQRFGLWELDPQTQVRRKRPSADLYGEIARENGLSSDMVARYAPEVLEKLFPD